MMSAKGRIYNPHSCMSRFCNWFVAIGNYVSFFVKELWVNSIKPVFVMCVPSMGRITA